MSVHWYQHPDARSAAAACAHHILSVLSEALEAQSCASLAVSGGSTPKLLFQELAGSNFKWRGVHLFWVDERAVPPNDPQSNFRLAEEWLIRPASIPRGQVHRICGELEPRHAARRYEEEVADYFGLEPGEMPRFDMIQRGMGADAHTASLFPDEPLIHDRENIAAAVYVEKLRQWRITLLPGVLLNAHHTAMLVTGEEKAEAVRAVFQEEYNPARYPAQLASQRGRSYTCFLDEAAARLVN